MTLIVGILTAEFVALGTDRRLTVDGLPVDDNSNKMVLLDDSFLVGYTGQAMIAGKRTHLWLAQLMADAQPRTLMGVLRNLQSQCERAWSTGHLRGRQAFLFVGWARIEGLDPARPIAILVSNYHADDWTEIEPAAVFSSRHRPLAGIPTTVVTVGQSLTELEITAISRTVRKRLKATTSRNSVQAVLVRCIRDQAGKNPLVGPTVLTAALPHPRGSRTKIVVAQSPGTSEYPTFLYFGNDDLEGTQYGPTWVTSGGTIVDGFKAGRLNPRM